MSSQSAPPRSSVHGPAEPLPRHPSPGERSADSPPEGDTTTLPYPRGGTAWDAARVYAGLSFLVLRRKRLFPFSCFLLALPLGVAVVALAARAFGVALFRQILPLYTDFLLLLLPAIHLAPALGEEMEARTLTYVFSRPAPRWTLPLGKFLALGGVLALGFIASLLVTYLICMLRDPAEISSGLPILGRALVGGFLGCAAFGALSVALGALFPHRPVMATLIYLLVVEGIFGHIPGFLKVVALSFHLRVVVGLHQGGATYEPNPEVWLSALVLGAGAVLLLWGASALANSMEYRADK